MSAAMKPETYVDYRGVARNVGSISEEATAVFDRQVKAHTFPLDDALDALPPGVKAWLYLQRQKLDLAERMHGELAARVATLEGEVAFLRNRTSAL